MPRRDAVRAIGAAALGAAGLTLGGCGRRGDSGADGAGEVMLYSSVDDFVLRDVVRDFERATGVTVRLLGDTEATKTTGLIERLVAERDEPRADVWWSSEPFGTIRLAEMGLFEPAGVTPPEVVDPLLRGKLDAADGSWFGFGLRARVLAVREGRFAEEEIPRRLRELTDARFRGRVGMARPRFGTTRGHMAALLELAGASAFRGWLEAMVANGLKIYDGNSTVVRAVSEAEIDICLTDTDDVWASQRNGGRVRAVFELADADAGGDADTATRAQGLPSAGPMLIPNTVAMVRHGPNAESARRLIEFLLGGRAEEILAKSSSHNIPVRREAFPDLAAFAVPGGWLPDLASVAALDARAMVLCDSVLGGG
ncbi:MAG: extracellular solute-binding protein [Planctomycetota bacterium]|nr:extracellular solute-binding protein [Planctomycetota bacterium]